MLIDITLTSLAEFSLSLCIAILPVFLIVGICTCVHVWITMNDIKKNMGGDIYAIHCKAREISNTVDYMKYDTSTIREILETAMNDETDPNEENAESN